MNGKENKYSYLFDEAVVMNWTEKSERHVADFGQDILKPLGIRTNNLKSEISFDETDLETGNKFLNSITKKKDEPIIIGLHVGAGKIPNRWGSDKFAELINLISEKYNASFYLTGTELDMGTIAQVKARVKSTCPLFINKTVPEVAALISKSDLFITNDTGIMHVAGAVNTSQISIFGPTNPGNWAPAGENKYWLKNENDIDSVSVNEVFKMTEKIIDNEK